MASEKSLEHQTLRSNTWRVTLSWEWVGDRAVARRGCASRTPGSAPPTSVFLLSCLGTLPVRDCGRGHSGVTSGASEFQSEAALPLGTSLPGSPTGTGEGMTEHGGPRAGTSDSSGWYYRTCRGHSTSLPSPCWMIRPKDLGPTGQWIPRKWNRRASRPLGAPRAADRWELELVFLLQEPLLRRAPQH